MPDAASLYLDLLQRALTRTGFDDEVVAPFTSAALKHRVARRLLAGSGAEAVVRHRPDPRAREVGADLPSSAETMVGEKRLDNLRFCVETVIRDGVPGDLVETGVWRGGASIFLRGLLAAHGVTDRVVWVADSFEGLPRPDAERYPADEGDDHWTRPELAISLEQVQANFARYGLLDDQVRFLKGWFKDTLATAPIDTLAVARLDGDLYESTTDALVALWPKVSVGGFVIIDDYGAIEACKAATDDFRAAHGIADELVQIDWTGWFWRRSP
ncbi:MAG: macrocin-O-methyltransferase [Frankiales bacterium]|nr:macrocin-O-methyltransferase [Frankiales bacterium]